MTCPYAISSQEARATNFSNGLTRDEGATQHVSTNAVSRIGPAKYEATMSVFSRVFYLQFRIDLKEGKGFHGKAGDIASPAGGALSGDLLTSNFPRLCQETVQFEFQSSSDFTTLKFFDTNGHLLGDFHGPALLAPAGTGTGTGKWI